MDTEMEEFVQNLLQISDLRVLTKKMVRKKYKEHLGTKELDPDIKDKLKQVIDKHVEELAQSQVEISDVTDIKTEDGNKENNSIRDIHVNCQNFSDSKPTTNVTIKSEPTDLKLSDASAIMSPPKKRIPRTVDKKEAPKRNMKFEDVMAAVQDSDATSGLDDPSDASSDFDMLQKLSGKSEEVSESAYEAESETDLDKTLTSKPKYFTPRRNHFEYNLSDSLNDSLGEITPVKRGILSDNELEDSPVFAKKSTKRKSLVSESGSESDNGALMIDLPTISSKHENNSLSVKSAQNNASKTDLLDCFQNDANDVFSLSDNEPLSKRLKEDDSITESDVNNTFLPGPKVAKKKGKSPAKKLLLKIKRVHNNSSDDNDYNYEISESNEEERTRKNQKSTVPSSDSDVMLVSHDAVVHQMLSNTDTDSNISGPVKRQRKNLTPAVVIDSDDDTSSTATEPLPVTINRKVKNKKPPNKKPARPRTAAKNPATPDDKELKFLRQICRGLGMVLRNTKELLGCTTSAEKVVRIRELLEKAGMEGEPTMKKVEALKLQKEVNELNEQNEKMSDEPTRGRPKRLAQTKLAERKKSPYVQDSSMFDGLEEIFDDEGSD